MHALPAACFALAALAAGAATAQAPRPPSGATLFLQCRACHELQPGGPAKVGPHLGGLFQRNIAALPGYAYSDALKAHKDERWTPQQLDQWLASPRSFAPGNLMAFQGVPDPARRAALIAYIQAQTTPARP